MTLRSAVAFELKYIRNQISFTQKNLCNFQTNIFTLHFVSQAFVFDILGAENNKTRRFRWPICSSWRESTLSKSVSITRWCHGKGSVFTTLLLSISGVSIIDFDFTSDWMTKRSELFKPIAYRGNAKPNQMGNTVDSQVKITLNYWE